MSYLRVCCVIACLTAVLVHAQDDESIAYTTTGPIQGTVTDGARRFLGIPYALPPVGDLRFARPRPANKWTDVRAATAFGHACMQNCTDDLPDWACPLDVSEDCLYLNVYTPRVAAVTKAPILVWFHGGNFRYGAGGSYDYDGEYMATKTNTIVVTVNYRLGAFGFLTTANTDGNYGVLDQRLAMKWIQANAAAFNGDPSRITIFGQSAGADSVGFHLIASESRGLFSQAIMESNPWSLTLRYENESLKLGSVFSDVLGCGFGDYPCYRSKTAEQILRAQTKAGLNTSSDSHFLEAFQPWEIVVGPGREVEMQPYRYYQAGNWAKVPVLAGTVAQEAVLYIYSGFAQPLPAAFLPLVFLELFGKELVKVIEDRFPIPANQTNDSRPYLSYVATEYVFACPTRNVSDNIVAQGVPTWMYQFDYASPNGAKGWGPLFPFCWDSVCHGSEIPFLWKDDQLIGLNFTQGEQLLSDTMISYWANFATTGNPNGNSAYRMIPRDGNLPVWPQYTHGGSYMHLSAPASEARTNIWGTDCDFWDQIDYNH